MTQHKNLIIIGTGYFAEVVKAYFEEYTLYKVCAFACHAAYKDADTFAELPLHTVEDLTRDFPPADYDVFVAVGYRKMNTVRQAVYEEIKTMGYTCTSFVHPDVKIWDSTTLGDNVFIFEDNTIQPFTSIGNNTILWSGNHIGHHSTIGDHCFISSHVVVSGVCTLGNNLFIGVNATLRDGITIADKTLIGAGAVIMKDTKPKEFYPPTAAKPYKKTSEEIGF